MGLAGAPSLATDMLQILHAEGFNAHGMASGGAVHNLDEVHHHTFDAKPPAYAHQFDRWLEEQIVGNHISDLLDYQRQAPQPLRCHPYPAEHFLPLFDALGAATGEIGRRLHDSFFLGRSPWRLMRGDKTPYQQRTDYRLNRFDRADIFR